MARSAFKTHVDIARICKRFPEIESGEPAAVFRQLCERFLCQIEPSIFSRKRQRWALQKFAKEKDQDWTSLVLHMMRRENNQLRHKRERVKHHQLKAVATQYAKKLTRQWVEAPSRLASQPEHLMVIAGLPGTKFYKTPEWQRLRMQVLTVRGPRCVLCGASRAHGVRLDVHHIEPRAMRPERSLDFDNLEVLCEPCHMGTHLAGAA
jgi:5-methylcytosine-specific restriction endonuclease McrA